MCADLLRTHSSGHRLVWKNVFSSRKTYRSPCGFSESNKINEGWSPPPPPPPLQTRLSFKKWSMYISLAHSDDICTTEWLMAIWRKRELLTWPLGVLGSKWLHMASPFFFFCLSGFRPECLSTNPLVLLKMWLPLPNSQKSWKKMSISCRLDIEGESFGNGNKREKSISIEWTVSNEEVFIQSLCHTRPQR